MSKNQELADFIWSVADLLRGDYKRSEYGKVILPLTVLRRLDCVMEPTRQAVWDRAASYTGENKDGLLLAASKLKFYNLSEQTFATISNDAANVAKNLKDYIRGFSSEATEIINRYEFHLQIDRLDNADLLYQVVRKFAGLDLSFEAVDNHDMGYVFEELIRKFADASNETAGEHFTPREVIELMVELLLAPDDARLTGEGQVVDILDPACGTGGMLSAAEEHIRRLNPRVRVNLFGQELNAESYAICRSDMLLKGHTAKNIRFGNSFSQDGHEGKTFNYMLANPPFGVEWKKVETAVREEAERGHDGRFGAGLPRINDGSLLFLQHMMSKMQPLKKDKAGDEVGGTRLAIVFNGSPLFTGGAGSGESEIRKWIIEHDYLEAVVALPDQLFYNTDISTYVWIVTNRKPADRKGRVILLDARDQSTKMRKSLGKKRKKITRAQIGRICAIYRDALSIADAKTHPDHPRVKVCANQDFGYQRITVDRPLKLRFELTEDSLTQLRASAAVKKAVGGEAVVELLLAALKPLLGSRWTTKAEAWDALRTGMVAGGVSWPSAAPFQKAMRDAVGVTDPEGEVQVINGKPEPDPDLRDNENVPLSENIDAYFIREVLPHVPDAWIAEIRNPKTKEVERCKVGYEIAFTRLFYVSTPPRPLLEIDMELKSLEVEIQALLGEVTHG
ncbi:SAM-dependent DNA methyltransferase [Streptacidiphilus sp. PB12-B1b]|uniref:type I restriction-modification system subunit M n=1 Tax=Streptacidiphilus sp. PB12-B1b TaxID=2705012 RepID=UPI0015FBE8EB|nr:class I SAM-dependent DNA methyltransferase [Streptacidiphilus sp. PB12-B1b]QMU79075.1 SAM-dependent DNA methyltransferase [Streptacidiphilus sp. PB12-B1b]